MPQELDLNEVFQRRASISIGPVEEDDERKERLESERREHTAELLTGYVVSLLVVIGIVAVGLLCGYEELLDPAASADTKKWAQTALTALFTGSISFALGNAVGKKK